VRYRALVVFVVVVVVACHDAPVRHDPIVDVVVAAPSSTSPTETASVAVSAPLPSASTITSAKPSSPRLRYPIGDPRNATFEGAGCASDLGGCTNGLICCRSDPRDFAGTCHKICPPLQPRAPLDASFP
jgi:hypothetical protein